LELIILYYSKTEWNSIRFINEIERGRKNIEKCETLKHQETQIMNVAEVNIIKNRKRLKEKKEGKRHTYIHTYNERKRKFRH